MAQLNVMQKNIRLIMAFLLGTISVLAFAPYYFYLIPIFTLAGLFYLWQESSSTKQAAKLGFMFGLGLFSIGIYWIYISLHDFGGMPWWMAGFATFVLCAFLSLFPATVAFLSKRCGHLLLSIPVFWALSEWVRSWIFTGFPWLTLGYSQVPGSPLVGFMPIIGVYGVSFITVLIAGLIALCFNHTKPERLKTFIAIVIIALVGGLLKLTSWTNPIGLPLSVALLQGNVGQDIKWSPETAEHTLQTYLSMAEQSHAKLIVLPETALPMLANQIPEQSILAFKNHALKNQGDILIGAVEGILKANQTEPNAYFNSLLSIGTAPAQTYRKSHLVPFGEFIPLKNVFGWIYRDWLNIPLSDLSRGGLQQPMLLSGQQVAINICYEDVFGEEIIHQLPQATLLVNASNDAWYGDSFAAYQHLQFSQARAIETGRTMLRATNTGATAMINPQGEVLAHAPHFSQTTLNVMAQGYGGVTPYIRWGNVPIISFLLLAASGLFIRAWKHKKLKIAN
ncbi:MAG: apolipoprotein N-acyltransferase [Methylophilaceae bacterium]|nr:apolipoprotein N-acyltransferase [Methylophilaceae bacterium]